MPTFHDTNRLLFVVRASNLQSTSDQAFTKVGQFTNYVPTVITALTVSGAASVACTGGIYTGAGKTGNALVAATQSWLGLSAVGKIVASVLAAVTTTDIQTATPNLSLTVGSTGAATADIFIFGTILD